MIWWWWILPAVVAAFGALIAISGAATLLRGKWFSGLFGTAAGATLLAAGAVAALLGHNIQTYHRLTYERPVATLTVRELAPQYFEVIVAQPATDDAPARTAVYPMNGDDWRMEAQVLKWKPWANVLGLNTQYRLDRLQGRYRDIEQERTGARSVHDLSGGDPPFTAAGATAPWTISTWDVARRYRRWFDAVDTLYGSATYMPMTDGAAYEVWITQSGLITRPANEAARAASAGGFSRVN